MLRLGIKREELDILIYILHICQFRAPCTVAGNKSVVHEVTLMRTGEIGTGAVLIHTVNLKITVLNILGIVD